MRSPTPSSKETPSSENRAHVSTPDRAPHVARTCLAASRYPASGIRAGPPPSNASRPPAPRAPSARRDRALLRAPSRSSVRAARARRCRIAWSRRQRRRVQRGTPGKTFLSHTGRTRQMGAAKLAFFGLPFLFRSMPIDEGFRNSLWSIYALCL
jgi:hypothetical protein